MSTSCIVYHCAGIDCDEVYPGIVLGNGATVKKKDYLKSIGVSHILNAAEFRGVNVGEDFYASSFKYKGLRVEDTPQTQICRWVGFFISPYNFFIILELQKV